MNLNKYKFLSVLFVGLFVISLGAPRMFLVMNTKTSPLFSNFVNIKKGISSQIELQSDKAPEFALLGKGSKIDYGAGAYYLAVIKEHNPRLVSNNDTINGENAKFIRIVDDLLMSKYFAIAESGNLYSFEIDSKQGRVAKLITKINPDLYNRIQDTEYFGSLINPETDVVASIKAKENSKAEIKANWVPNEEIVVSYSASRLQSGIESKYEFQKYLRTADQMKSYKVVNLKINS